MGGICSFSLASSLRNILRAVCPDGPTGSDSVLDAVDAVADSLPDVSLGAVSSFLAPVCPLPDSPSVTTAVAIYKPFSMPYPHCELATYSKQVLSDKLLAMCEEIYNTCFDGGAEYFGDGENWEDYCLDFNLLSTILISCAFGICIGMCIASRNNFIVERLAIPFEDMDNPNVGRFFPPLDPFPHLEIEAFCNSIDDGSLALDFETDGGVIPDFFKCPISLGMMREPVIAPDGETYDRGSIEGWLRGHNASPITREIFPLGSRLNPNRALQRQILSFVRDHPGS